FTDFGIVHGTEPENAWLRSGESYRLATRSPHPRRVFELTHSATFSGGRGWRCNPTVNRLLRDLGITVADFLRRDNRVTVPVEIHRSHDE
ncbi:MAG TPA: hypothetical protein VF100_04895, partial [Thermoanaerobaculia bacterium]